MKLKDGVNLIAAGVTKNANPQKWADLGCGSGFFSNVLAQLLPSESSITGVDTSYQTFQILTERSIDFSFRQADFTQDGFELEILDGILIANALHYVRDKRQFIANSLDWFREGARFIIVEYDTRDANQWVPFPLPFDELPMYFDPSQFNIEKIGERSSIFDQSKIYAATIASKP
ncbi:class I SAM-dependent methyltransferase [Belliella kenyensis]|uniref:Class I SAM-dependent methyltransferase n=1 Tax=Belliella kenyensis TaxID=1472724 RepID=A0ABV8EGF0_9BACT|nr:class I SAM-dependent methyltransferase [Belliella kenyensis]MCH7402472.1 class I SAM-dependent methyltransferase [Belliella kenyensis]MDN3603663.1 class I SAM-dependent methyltransferase [Belliella kenyensis]